MEGGQKQNMEGEETEKRIEEAQNMEGEEAEKRIEEAQNMEEEVAEKGIEEAQNMEEEVAEKGIEEAQNMEKEEAEKGIEEANEKDEDGTVIYTVKHIHERPDRFAPVVAYFSTGYDPYALNPKTGEKQTPKVRIYKHKDESLNRIQVVVSPPNSKVDFVGTNYSGEQAARQTTSYSLAYLNKRTKIMRVLPIACNKVIRLEPIIRKTVADSGEANSNTEDNKSLSQDGKVNQVDVNAGAVASTSCVVARNIPPYDASATTPMEVYPLEKIIEKAEWNHLKDIYQLLQQETREAAEMSLSTYPLFVRNRFCKLQDIQDENEKLRLSCVLSLLTHLVKFKDVNSTIGYRSAKDHKFPEIIIRKCKSLFKAANTKGISIDKTNLLMNYVLVLTLHVDNFKTNPQDITKDLRISDGGLRKNFVNLGCRFARDNSVLLATLTVPPKFPKNM